MFLFVSKLYFLPYIYIFFFLFYFYNYVMFNKPARVLVPSALRRNSKKGPFYSVKFLKVDLF